MGSWSVYCGISNIAITSGRDCCLMMIWQNKNDEYLPWLPATLPIFGKYNDYGSMEHVIPDENTKLIEEHFGITIDEYITYFVDGELTYSRDEYKQVKKKLSKERIAEMKGWNYMWIDRKVYDFMTTHIPLDDRGHIDLGSKEMLDFLGFKFEGTPADDENYDTKRFKFKYSYGDKIFYSDGNTLLVGKSDYVYHILDRYQDEEEKYPPGKQALEAHIKIPEDKMFLADKAPWQIWEISPKTAKRYLLGIMGKRWDGFSDTLGESLAKLAGKTYEPPRETIRDKYSADLHIYGKMIEPLVTFRKNLHCMSGQFHPYVLYLTPQCGEHKEHQVLLDKFAEINREIVKEYYE